MTGRLLILDDEPSVGATISFIAEDAGFEVRAVEAPDAFFREYDAWEPTHIAVDLMLPQMDGVEVLQHLAARQCTAAVIITSGVGNRVLDAARRTAAENGLHMLGVLPKPFTAEALRTLLQSHLPDGKGARAQRISQPTDAEPTEEELRAAIAAGDLVLAFQPKVQCSDGALAGFEALVRWKRNGRIVYPDRFIPLAERTGLIDALTDVVVRDAVAWQATHFPGGETAMSVNISARSLVALDLGERLVAHCEACGLDPARVTLEVTESSAMEDPKASLALLTRLRVRGFKLSIDDFGTGFSSMVQLVRLPFSEIKVDKSFVMNLTASEESRAVVRSIVDLGKSLGLRSTAEGVEDAAALAYLREVGCDLAQGYHIAKPLFGPDAVNWALTASRASGA